ncbi:family 65 glycosyl hydrolase, partial [Salmonella enterica subsp. enterica serovar Haifa]|nr:family 65 glycosyl hydrolase [Salmonella enterica subsp. enterica serovar Haifa]
LRWRHATLDRARERARTLHLDGAAFPWRTIDGRESSGYWPASTAAFHINAAVAGAVMQYVRATGDTGFEREAGAEILIETARLWLSLGRWDADGAFHIDGVTGPDEYSAIVDDNVYTNLAARRNLRGAVEAARRHPDIAAGLGVDDAETERWEAAAQAMAVPFDEEKQVHAQSAGFTAHAPWDFDATGPEQYPLHSYFPYFDLYRKQVLKQADLVLALYTSHEEFTREEKARAFAYYDALTVRDSSLSAMAQVVIAAEVGHLDLAAAYLAELAALDLADLHGNTAEGLHIAALAGIWTGIT